MHALLALTLLFGQTSSPAAAPAGCEKRCEKKYVPCKDRVDQQMMCFEVVRRCELRCDDKKPAQTPALREK